MIQRRGVAMSWPSTLRIRIVTTTGPFLEVLLGQREGYRRRRG
jgi:hypothetical protein